MPPPNQLPKLQFPEMDPVFQQHYSQLIDTVNSLAGHNGPVQLASHLDLGGNRVMNVGQPVDPTDALPSGTAQRQYSAAALKPQLESNGSSALSTYRQINNKNQREMQSSFLNGLMSSPPSANGIYPTNPSGKKVSIPASRFTFSDGSTVSTVALEDTVAVGNYSIVSIVGDGTTVTIVATGTPPFPASNQNVTISDTILFNGTYRLRSSSAGTMTYLSSVVGAETSGTVTSGGIYYYALIQGSQNLVRIGPFIDDTAQNRLEANYDGYQIVAVADFTGGSYNPDTSGGGASPTTGSPTAGSFF